jgi:hypothetical protein
VILLLGKMEGRPLRTETVIKGPIIIGKDAQTRLKLSMIRKGARIVIVLSTAWACGEGRHELPGVSPRPALPTSSAPFTQGRPAYRVDGLRPSSTLLDTLRRTLWLIVN